MLKQVSGHSTGSSGSTEVQLQTLDEVSWRKVDLCTNIEMVTVNSECENERN